MVTEVRPLLAIDEGAYDGAALEEELFGEVAGCGAKRSKGQRERKGEKKESAG